jgi:dihydrolipoamide dehydrogenase
MKRLAIIGGGPAGYVAAITAAGQGKDVILIEQGDLGGTCLNEGCMPTKSLLKSAEMLEKVKHANQFGIELPRDQVKVDWNQVLRNKNNVVKKLVDGIGYLMRKNRIKVMKGKATFLTDHSLCVEESNGQEIVTADQFIIATGSEPIELPFAPFDKEWTIDSRQAMSLPTIPDNLLIIGGGVIGCEFASIYSRMGTKVSIVEMTEQLLPGEDADIAAILHQELEKAGVDIYTSTTLKQLDPGKKEAILENQNGVFHQQAQYVLVSVGRRPRFAELGLEKIGVHLSKKGIEVNDQMQTNIPHIYACGDVISGIQLAHVAFHEGRVAALHASGKKVKVNYHAVPRCIYTSPEIASVGLTEKQAREQYGDLQIGEFPFSANGKALILREQVGKVKIIIEPQYNEIVGLSIIGPLATELIGQGVVMLQAEMTAEGMENFISAHPSVSEAIQEALLGATGHALHM